MKTMYSFYKNKKVLITGHTGFKGTWLCVILELLGAKVIGYSLDAGSEPSVYNLSGISNKITSVIGDVRDFENLKDIFEIYTPDIVFHLAAQPIVRESYKDPLNTYSTNVMGTANICEAIKRTPSVKVFVNVTTDKVYLNKEQIKGYKEDDELNGFDPYSNSKSCSELVTSSYGKCFFTDEYYRLQYGDDFTAPAVVTCRAGNVIGGGDFSNDRIVPDCVRAALNKKDIIVRNPNSIRPYQHVLDALFAYLKIAQTVYSNKKYAGSYNVGPNDEDCITTGELVDLFCAEWNNVKNDNIGWVTLSDNGPHEANYLKLDCTKIKTVFGWEPRWNISRAISSIVEWVEVYLGSGDISACMQQQIKMYLE